MASRYNRPPLTPARRLARWIISVSAKRVAREYLSAIRPLLAHNVKGELDVEGTALLFKIGDHRFLITAAHVLDATAHTDLYIAGLKDIVALEGIKRCTNSPAGQPRRADVYDVGFMELATEYDQVLKGCRFLTVDDCDLNEQPTAGVWSSKYLVIGYPTTKLKRNPAEGTVIPRPFIFTASPAKSSQYPQLERPSHSHIVLDFTRRRVLSEEGEQTAPKPQGISGGVILHYRSLMARAPGSDTVVAVIKGGATADRGLWGTRIACHLEAIRHYHPALSDLIPQARNMRVRVR